MRSYGKYNGWSEFCEVVFWAGMLILLGVWCDRMNLDLLRLLAKSFGF